MNKAAKEDNAESESSLGDVKPNMIERSADKRNIDIVDKHYSHS